MALTEDCFYSQVTDTGCCGDHGVLRIPILNVKDIRQQSCKYYSNRKENFDYYFLDFNGRYRADHPHMVITYVVNDTNGSHEYQAGWQMNESTFNQWKTAIEQLRDRHPASELA